MHSARREATRRKLHEAAVTLIAEQGFSSTTVDEIAERAGVAKGTVYYNFGNKAELFEEVLRHGVGTLAAALREAAALEVKRTGSRLDALDALIAAGLGFAAGNPAFTRLFAAEVWRTNRPWHAALLTARQEVVAVVAETLEEAVAAGELRPDLDVPLTASGLFGMVLVAALDWQAFPPDRPVAEVHAALSRLLRGGVLYGAGGGTGGGAGSGTGGEPRSRPAGGPGDDPGDGRPGDRGQERREDAPGR